MRTPLGAKPLVFLPSLAAALLMATLPFLWPVHTTPIASFHAEWLAALFGLLTSLCLLGAPRLPLPGATLLSLALAAIALLQLALGRAPVPQLSTLFVWYLLWAALLASAGRHLAGVFGVGRLSRVLAAAILAGSCLAALASLLQPWLLETGWTGLPAKGGGSLAQPNHLVGYLWLGVASAMYLRGVTAMAPPLFWAATVLLIFTAVLTGQRSSFMYVLALAGVAAWQAKSDGDKAPLLLVLKAALLFVLLQPLVAQLPGVGGSAISAPSVRFVRDLGGPSIRVQLARLGMLGIGDAPLLGNGIGSYPGLALVHAGDVAPADNPGPAEHAHNLLIDLGAELGLPAALLVLLWSGAWLRSLPKRGGGRDAAWAAGVFAIIGLHSMVEYPLWHSYFLGLLAMIAGAFGGSREIGRRLAPVALCLGLVIWGALNLAQLRRDYRQIELALSLGASPATMPRAGDELLQVPQTSPLMPWVNAIACTSLDPLEVAMADGLAVCREATAFAPGIETMANFAVLEWRAGNAAAARERIDRIRRASQYDPKGLDGLLVRLESREPGLAAVTKGER